MFRVGNPADIGDGPAAVTGDENGQVSTEKLAEPQYKVDTDAITGRVWRNISR